MTPAPAADPPALAPVRRYLAAGDPTLDADEVDAGLAAFLALCLEQASGACVRPDHRALERSLVRAWLAPSPDHAQAYLAALAPVLRASLAAERAGRPARPVDANPVLALPAVIGPYRADAYLGSGGDGIALGGVDTRTSRPVTIKLPARGDTDVFDHLGDDWHVSLLRSLDLVDLGVNPQTGIPDNALVREPADFTLADELRRRQRLPLADALDVFGVCCAVVAWLHDRHVYRWSAHPSNVFRVGGAWKVGDFGRSLVFVDRDHPLLAAWRAAALVQAGRDGDDAEAFADFVHEHLRWGLPSDAGLFAYHPERERRHRMDDCAMLGGLLCDLLTGRRWGWFTRALSQQPYCSVTYALTGRKATDAALSRILNRCWRGDAGGAPLLANDGRGEQTVYDDARELLADVAAALGAA